VTVELRPAGSLRLGELAKLFTAAYEGYVLPFRIDEPTLRFMIDAYDIDLDSSRVAYRGGEPVGLANLAVRGEDGWIGGVGVVPAARRQGIGETLMRAVHDEARARGLHRVWLEVIEANEHAFLLYEKLGYAVTRELEVWSLASEQPPGSAEQIALEVASTLLPDEREPWQRADESVAHQQDVRAVGSARGAAIFRVVNGNVSLLQIGGAELDDVLRSVRTYGPVSVLNLPRGESAAAAFEALGGTMVVRQREMVLDLEA
jgi:ribosomal protein S18 acetylase RimI-like enzyme